MRWTERGSEIRVTLLADIAKPAVLNGVETILDPFDRCFSFRVWRLACATLLALAALIPTSIGAAASSQKCPPPADSQVVTSSKHAVVYRTQRNLMYGCMYKVNKVRLLDGQTPRVALHPQLAGRFVSYTLHSDDSDVVVVYDLRRGSTLVRQPAVGHEEGITSSLRISILKPTGSVAWIGQGPQGDPSDPGHVVPSGDMEVHRVNAKAPASNRLLDRGPDIAAGYLAFSRDGKRFFWNDNGKRSARLQ
jgi:hypothetical protein